MAEPNSKFLVQLLSGFSKPQLLFITWAAVVGFFTLLILSFYKKSTRRNFRDESDGPGPRVRVDARQLKDSHEAKEMTIKKGTVGVKNSYRKGPGGS